MLASRSWVRDCRHSAALLFVDARTPPLDSGLRRNDEWGAGVTNLARGNDEVVAGVTTLEAGRWGFAVPRPRRFVNRPYGDVGGWWDAGGQYRAGSDAGGSDQLLLFRRLVTLVV